MPTRQGGSALRTHHLGARQLLPNDDLLAGVVLPPVSGKARLAARRRLAANRAASGSLREVASAEIGWFWRGRCPQEIRDGTGSSRPGCRQAVGSIELIEARAGTCVEIEARLARISGLPTA
jgi:hypothetical protein